MTFWGYQDHFCIQIKIVLFLVMWSIWICVKSLICKNIYIIMCPTNPTGLRTFFRKKNVTLCMKPPVLWGWSTTFCQPYVYALWVTGSVFLKKASKKFWRPEYYRFRHKNHSLWVKSGRLWPHWPPQPKSEAVTLFVRFHCIICIYFQMNAIWFVENLYLWRNPRLFSVWNCT